jgi:hypothetical protein
MANTRTDCQSLNRDTVGTAIKKLIKRDSLKLKKSVPKEGSTTPFIRSNLCRKQTKMTMRKNPARKNRHGKSDTKKEPSFEDY